MYGAILIALCIAIFQIADTISVDDTVYTEYTAYSPRNAECVEYVIPTIISAQIYKFNATQWNSDYGLADFVALYASRKDANTFLRSLNGPFDFGGNFTISATFCNPRYTSWTRSVMVATHGLGFDRK
jgi:hypothetical protein